MTSPARPRIFVRIPSYRDPECQWTVKDLFEKAAHPERIFVGICWQYDPVEDAHCFKEPYPYPDQVRLLQYNAKDSKGCCWARSQIDALWQGEEYAMQIDSHMRFEPGWDESLISMVEQCDSPKAVLTSYPTGYTPGRPISHKCVVGLAADRFDYGQGILFIRSCYFPQGYEPDKPIKGCFAAGGFMFSRAERFTEVPIDPHLYFFGEEVLLSARMYTHGWDMYHPNKPVIYHYYSRDERRNHYEDHHNWQERDQHAFARIRHIMGMELSADPSITAEAEHYGFGTVRTLEEYEHFAGVNFMERSISARAKEGIFMDEFRDVAVSGMAAENMEWIENALKAGTSSVSLESQMLGMGFPEDHVVSAISQISERLTKEGYTVNHAKPEASATPVPQTRSFDEGMRRWLAGSLLEGCAPDQLQQVLQGLGYDAQESAHELALLQASPFLPEAKELQATVKKREWLMTMLDQQFRRNGKYGGEVPRIKTPRYQDFLKEYYNENVPVILTDAIKKWPARKWTPQLLKERLGDAMIEVQFGREADPDFERNAVQLRRAMRMGDYIDLVLSTEKSNDFYMTAGNLPKSKHAYAELYQDIGNIRDGYLNDAGKMDSAFLWVGPAGTLTPLHHDLTNNLFVQVYGRKRFILIPPLQIGQCYNRDYVYCDVDIFNIDYDKYPDMQNATMIDLTLNPGETLLIPNCWLHAVEALDTSISITFTNFTGPNYIDGYPGRRRYT